MKNTIKILLFLALLVSFPSQSFAMFKRSKNNDRDCDHRRPGYYHSYDRPVSYYGPYNYGPYNRYGYNGRISASEAQRLRADQREIFEKRRRYFWDGKLTGKERKDLNNEYNDYHQDLVESLQDRNRGWWW